MFSYFPNSLSILLKQEIFTLNDHHIRYMEASVLNLYSLNLGLNKQNKTYSKVHETVNLCGT